MESHDAARKRSGPGAGVLALLLAATACTAPQPVARTADATQAAADPHAGSRILSGLSPVGPMATATETRAFAFLTLSVDCPVSNTVLPQFEDLSRRWAGRGIQFVEIYPNLDESNAQVMEHRIEFGAALPAARDPEGAFCRRNGLRVTPQVLLVAADGRILYRGRLHDQFESLGVRRPAPRRLDFERALEEWRSNGPGPLVETKAIGCRIRIPAPDGSR